MEWLQVLSLFLANAGLILWFRTESRNDWRHMDIKLDAFMKEVQEERKEFHGRLEKIEQEFKGKLALQDQEYKNHLVQYHMQATK